MAEGGNSPAGKSVAVTSHSWGEGIAKSPLALSFG